MSARFYWFTATDGAKVVWSRNPSKADFVRRTAKLLDGEAVAFRGKLDSSVALARRALAMAECIAGIAMLCRRLYIPVFATEPAGRPGCSPQASRRDNLEGATLMASKKAKSKSKSRKATTKTKGK